MWALVDKDFKATIINMLRELEKNTMTMIQQNTQQLENRDTKKEPNKILELKIPKTEMRNSQGRLESRFEIAKEIISKLDIG